MARVVLAMSGGVDSSVAAWLLRERGYEVVGLFMRHGREREEERRPIPENTPPARRTEQNCCSAADAADARRVADALDIPFHVLDFQAEFDRIIDYFVAEYASGRTPNPCIVCNTWLKFGRLFDYADRFGAEYVATGHHARIEREGESGFPALRRARDESKDQSYALFGIRRALLGRLLFPVGEHLKEDIRGIADRLGLNVARKRDSQEICFVPDRDHARFVREKRGRLDTSGEIVATDGTPLGRHDGYERFTIGQRKGLRLAFGEPRYVVRIEADTRRVVIGVRDDLARRELTASNANWLIENRGKMQKEGERGKRGGDRPNDAGQTGDVSPLNSVGSPGLSTLAPHSSPPILPPAFRAQVKIRYRSRPYEATVEPLAAQRFRVRFDEPCFGVAPGQAAVCYDGDRVLGGGWID